ncbi:MAG TPA: ATP-binding protein [Pyrinomonadaceae bacterium]|nr:ATP-binding protein [Pyrinomonadaceae bacterium]
MTTFETSPWHVGNAQYLMARMAIVRERIVNCHRTGDDIPAAEAEESTRRIEALEAEAVAIAESMNDQTALDRLCDACPLSAFERDLLVLCAGVELDREFAQLCAAAQGQSNATWATFQLALNGLADANWEAIAPAASLRLWRLVELDRGENISTSPLRIDERILQFLIGASYLDDRLAPFFRLVDVAPTLSPSYENEVARVIEALATPDYGWPLMHLAGKADRAKLIFAAACSASVGLRLHLFSITNMPPTALERETLFRLWQREALLVRSGVFVDAEGIQDAGALRYARSFIERFVGPVFVTDRRLLPDSRAPVLALEIDQPPAGEQRAIWESELSEYAEALNGDLDQIVSQFKFDGDTIRSIAQSARAESAGRPEHLAQGIWHACRTHARTSLDGLAECIQARATWDDLVLPPEQTQTLSEIAAQVRQRLKVYDSWGFAARTTRGLGISALFAGPSGTGKTLAAEVLANDLQLDLYRIDLSQVVSKYIGETEKNLRAVFDAAETSGAVLLFDEADALFGKRSEVRDSHDRYANIEVSYLLQRMESYRGLAILTTNRRSSLDTAFLRRIRFVIPFPFPDAGLRERIWARIFPPETPTRDLDTAKLARLNVTGGNIRNIALNAAFLAADMDQPVAMIHLLRTSRSECAKIEKQITTAETGGWV